MQIKINDIIMISAILLVALAAALFLFLTRTEGDIVSVKMDGVLLYELPLSENREIRIESEGGGYNVLVIEDGCAYVKDASCPDGICSSHRPISHGGESIICLPNKVVIELRSATSAPDEPDVIA